MKKIRIRATKSSLLTQFLPFVRPVETNHPLIRIGCDTDGGYLVPNDLEGITACYSPGVDQTSDFEKECAERGMQVFMADASVDRPAVEHKHFSFLRKFIGNFTQGQHLSLEDWIRATGAPDGDLLLQMDIEGYEYETLLGLSMDRLQQFRILVIEFHNLEQLLVKSSFDLLKVVFEKLSYSHQCVHIHPNNHYPRPARGSGLRIPRLAEFTYLRKDRIQTMQSVQTLPHPLDQDCTRNRSLVLPPEWYRSST